MPTLQHRLVRAFVDLSDTLVADFDITEVLYTLVERVMDIYGVAAVGLMLADEQGRLRVVASSGRKARLIELLELQQREGPCYDAFSTGKDLTGIDMAAERGRWPAVTDEALEAGYTTVHAIPLRIRNDVIGAMNIFETDPPVLGEEEFPAVRAMAEIATIAILQSRAINEARETTDQLRVALRTRIVLEQAKGILAQADGISMDEAFAQLRGYARNRRLRLAEVARQVVEGDLDGRHLTESGSAPTPP